MQTEVLEKVMEKTRESSREISCAINAAFNVDAAASVALEFSENATGLIKGWVTPSVTLESIGLAKNAVRMLLIRLDEAEEAVKKIGRGSEDVSHRQSA
jgi:hypothetical protein